MNGPSKNPRNQNTPNRPSNSKASDHDPVMDAIWDEHAQPHLEAHGLENAGKTGQNTPSPSGVRVFDFGWLRAEFGIVKDIADSGKIWHSTTALDKNPVQPKRGAERDQTVVHALLRTKDQIPKEAPAPDLKRKIANKLHDIEPVPARQAGVTDALRIGAVPACVAVLLAVGIHFATTNMSSSGVATKSETTVAAGDADPVNPGARLKPLSPEELFVPIPFSKGDVVERSPATDNATISSLPVAREASAVQKTVNALQEALNRHMPPKPERPK